MGRIRSIKPDFPQSESMGNVSRNARLLFILLWTIVDDSGRTRASSRMLASLLFPYDDDAGRLIDGWLSELAKQGCIRLYEADGSKYLDLPNWLKHQRIDKPSQSKIPQFDEYSTKPREASKTDKDKEEDKDKEKEEPSSLRSDGAEAQPEAHEVDFRTDLFRRGLDEVVKATGVPAPKARALIGSWLKTASDEAVIVLTAIDAAVESRPADFVPWVRRAIENRMSNRPQQRAGPTYHPRPRTAHDAIADELRKYENAKPDHDHFAGITIDASPG